MKPRRRGSEQLVMEFDRGSDAGTSGNPSLRGYTNTYTCNSDNQEFVLWEEYGGQ